VCQRNPPTGLAGAALLLLGAGLALAAVPAPAPAADPDAAARALGARLAAVRALEARFQQTIDSMALASPQVEEGRVFLQRPGRMRWEYTRPKGKLAIADGSHSWLYLPEDRQVIKAPLASDQADTGLGLLWREEVDLLKEFRADWEPVRASMARRLRLHPRASGAPYDVLLVTLDASGFPVALTVVDPLGGRVTYTFADIRFKDRLDPALFEFTPPAGVAVQDVAP
jgi:outer membrane lipoprotein carrier protein